MPFGADAAPRIDLSGLVHELRLGWRRDSLAAVEPRAHRVLTRGGERLPYDLLVVATGARSQESIPGAVTFRGPLNAGAVEGVLDRAAREPQLRLVFAAPAGATWPLPLYELALMSSGPCANARSPIRVSPSSRARPSPCRRWALTRSTLSVRRLSITTSKW